MSEVKRTVYLHGSLGKKFGKTPIQLVSSSIRDTFCGLHSALGEAFTNTIRDGSWHISTGTRSVKTDKPHKSDNFRSAEELDLSISEEELHIFPAIVGAGGKQGIFQIIIGIIIVVVCWWNPLGWGAATLLAGYMMGASMIIGGATSLLTKTPTVSSYDNSNVDRKPSFIFNGPVNVQEQGGPVPLVYGKHLTGSVVISSAVKIQQL